MENNTIYESLSHSKWECKYHMVFMSKMRNKRLYGAVRKFSARVFHKLAEQRGSKIIKGNMVG